MSVAPFPVPDGESLAVSEALVATIRAEIDAAGGWIGFERFMQLALNAPGLGYYSAGAVKLGQAGDFTTAPEISDWLAAAVAPFAASVLEEIGSNRIVELGAGSGRMAGQLLTNLQERGNAAIDYSILEVSADLRQRQQAHLEPWQPAVSWLDSLPAEPLSGIVVANEVADTLPVTRFLKSGQAVLPLGVAWRQDRLVSVPGPPDEALSEAVERIEIELCYRLPDGYRSEICLLLRPWLGQLLGAIGSGGLLLIDYGMSRRDFYRPERMDGTLICHFRHRAHADPLLWPGLQDISAWIDFSAVAGLARDLGFSVAGFTTQSQFMVETIAGDPALSARAMSPEGAGTMRKLVLPGEMGEQFKLMWLATDGVATPLPGRDFRGWL